MKILCTHPGRYGDLLWALPTIRALSVQAEAPVELLLPPGHSAPSLVELLSRQPYLTRVWVANDWATEQQAPISPRIPPTVPSGYDRVVHLGYTEWPRLPLPYEAARLADIPAAKLRLDSPWIEPTFELPPYRVAVGFTEEYFEMKYGLTWLLYEHLAEQGDRSFVNVSTGPRWSQEAKLSEVDWIAAAGWIAAAEIFVGCCSALHVLAVALGKPVILVEPQAARHAEIFYPLGIAREVQLLLGNDGKPTFDARHLMDAVDARLRPRCDHKFVDSTSCLKCGWTPPREALA